MPARERPSPAAASALGYALEWREYDMPHAVCPAEIADVGAWLRTHPQWSGRYGVSTIAVPGGAGAEQTSTLTLLLTTACNLRCTYCYSSAGEALEDELSPDELRAAELRSLESPLPPELIAREYRKLAAWFAVRAPLTAENFLRYVRDGAYAAMVQALTRLDVPASSAHFM